ncbi:hypothetical protein V6N13_034339 [Hibiscus sabdariffa]
MLSISTTPDSLHCLMKNSIIVLIACLCVHGQPTQGPLNEYLNVRRSDFPDDFLFGASTSAAQIEGSTKSGGKGPSAWDQFIREFPDIKPFVNLMHFDQPEALQNKYGGFLNHSIVNDFKDYAEICFKTFGDRVKNWVTINEPLIIAKLGHALGIGPPGRCSDRKMCPSGNSATEPYIVSHNVLLAHATAANLYKHKYQATQGGQIGISHVAQYFEPYSNTSLDEEASKRAIDFELGWFMEPLVRGDYPESMRRLVKDRLPVFTAEEKELVKGSFDFIAISYYSSRYAKDIPTTPNAAPVSYMVDSNVNVTGYTEKSNDNIPISQTLKDDIRIDFVQKHLYQTQTAIKNGVNVKGYFYYSLIDSFEWGEGYTVRYGLYHVDFKNLTRSPKESAKWYHDFIKGRAVAKAMSKDGGMGMKVMVK